MDFITSLPRSQNQFDFVWFIMDRMKKSAHFLPVRTNFSDKDYVRLYHQEIVNLHGAPISIISDRGMQFSYHF